MIEDEINEAVAEFGTPQYVDTEDSEIGYWQFSEEGDTIVADSIGQLLSAGISILSIRAKVERLKSGISPWSI